MAVPRYQVTHLCGHARTYRHDARTDKRDPASVAASLSRYPCEKCIAPPMRGLLDGAIHGREVSLRMTAPRAIAEKLLGSGLMPGTAAAEDEEFDAMQRRVNQQLQRGGRLTDGDPV